MFLYVEDSVNADFDLTINAAISKAGAANAGTFFKDGAGTLLLSGSNTFSAAGLRVDNGRMVLGVNDPANGSAGALGTASVQMSVGYNTASNFDAALLLRDGVTSARGIRTLNNTSSGHAA
ncbi:MAG: hypothetical protein EBR28_11280, partial [Planctomycetia bacterium]|nr:hypothetical protein [Planctomycetia bacterium]